MHLTHVTVYTLYHTVVYEDLCTTSMCQCHKYFIQIYIILCLYQKYVTWAHVQVLEILYTDSWNTSHWPMYKYKKYFTQVHAQALEILHTCPCENTRNTSHKSVCTINISTPSINTSTTTSNAYLICLQYTSQDNKKGKMHLRINRPQIAFHGPIFQHVVHAVMILHWKQKSAPAAILTLSVPWSPYGITL